MRDYYEDLWSRLPAELAPVDFERRCAFLLEHVREGRAVLDLGAAQGDFAAAAAAAGARVVAVEVAAAAVARARERHPELDVRLAPVEGPLPLGDAEVDVVWAGHVIERVADTARWLSEARRVLSPRGLLLLTTPAHGRLRSLPGFDERFDPLGDRLRFYSARSLRRVLGELGFDEIAIRTRRGTIYTHARRPPLGDRNAPARRPG